MITHLEIQLALAFGVAAIILFINFTHIVPVISGEKPLYALAMLPWFVTVGGLYWWHRMSVKAKTRYDQFLKNSPGKEIDASEIEHGPGHPV